MTKSIRNIYVIHHSHTDIGYTDLQERVIFNQINNIRTAVKLAQADPRFKWNCETWFCVEKFLEEADENEKEAFFSAVGSGNIGISANYLNFTDLAEPSLFAKRIKEMKELFSDRGIEVRSAMTADINGVSMGYRDALLSCGIDFFYTNIHTYHGMYPLYRNQQPFFWENDKGERLLVFNAEHYNLGNALGIVPNRFLHPMTERLFGKDQPEDPIDALISNLGKYLDGLTQSGYPYSFLPISVSGVFSDNAPPNPGIPDILEKVNARCPEIHMEMVTLDGMFQKIRDELKSAPVYRGDFTDWWADGIGSTPYSLKHFLAARRTHLLCDRLDPGGKMTRPDELREAENNLLLYAEHTWGHSATVTDPAETMVLDLDIRKTSYASKAHEAASKRLYRITHKMGDILRYYDLCGKLNAINPTDLCDKFPVEFFVETPCGFDCEITDENGRRLPAQVSPHPRGARITFTDTFAPHEQKTYTYKESTEKKHLPKEPVSDGSAFCIENDTFRISGENGKGITSFLRKTDNKELIKSGSPAFFTPVYERTEIRTNSAAERYLCDKNIRGTHARCFFGTLTDADITERGDIFTTVRLKYHLEGTQLCELYIKLYNELSRLDLTLKAAKTPDTAIESLFLPLTLDLPGAELFIEKGSVPMRPGIDQLPGTCMEYYISDSGILYRENEYDTVIQTKDTALLYMGELKHHPIVLCDGKREYNSRDVYSWIMNNVWDTNFKMDLSGSAEFRYSLCLKKRGTDMKALSDGGFDILTFITK